MAMIADWAGNTIVACTGWVRVKKGEVVGYAPTAYLVTERRDPSPVLGEM